MKAGLLDDDLSDLHFEISILKSLRHPNIVRLVDSFEDDNVIFIVLEHLSGGDFFDRIVRKISYNEMEARDAVLCLLNGVKCCHDNKIVHRDIRPENIVLSTPESDSNVKLIDFGTAIKLNDDDKCDLMPPQFCSAYMAPEILRSEPYDTKVDMWCVGVILHILLSGYTPFQNTNNNLLENIKRGVLDFDNKYWNVVSSDAKDLVTHLLDPNPETRYSCEEAINHPWINMQSRILAANKLDSNLVELLRYQAMAKPCKFTYLMLMLCDIFDSCAICMSYVIDQGSSSCWVTPEVRYDILKRRRKLFEKYYRTGIVREPTKKASKLNLSETGTQSLNGSAESVNVNDISVSERNSDVDDTIQLYRVDTQLNVQENKNNVNDDDDNINFCRVDTAIGIPSSQPPHQPIDDDDENIEFARVDTTIALKKPE